MPVNIDVNNENFDFIARAAGYVRKQEVEALMKQIAEVLQAEGVVPPWLRKVPESVNSPTAVPAETGPSPGVDTAGPGTAEVPEYVDVNLVAPKKKAGRPRKVKAEQATDAAASPAEGSFAEAVADIGGDKPAADIKLLGLEDVKQALRELASRLDLDASRKLLDHFGAKKASEVPAEKIADFVEASKLEAKTIAEFEAALKVV